HRAPPLPVPPGFRSCLSSSSRNRGLSTLNPPPIPVGGFGGAKGIRTPDLLNAIQTLFQLSYSPRRSPGVYQRASPAPGSPPRAMMVEAMSNASLDRLLAVLLTAAAGTGFLTLHSGQPGDAWLFVLHDLVTGALGIAAVVKLRRSLPRAVIGRRWPRLMVAVVLTGTVGGALAGGYLWVAGGGLAWADLASGRWTVLTLHAWLGLAIAAVAFIHLLP